MQKGKGGFKNAIWTGIMLVLIISGIFGWAKVNNITSITGVYDYFKGASDKINSCGADHLEWNCTSDGSSENNGESVPGSTGITKDVSLSNLEKVKVADAKEVSYKRTEWKHWIGSPCDTRETILKEQGKDVQTDPSTCKVTAGKWVDPYSNDTFDKASGLDIDHVIPLSYAAQHGGQDWDAAKKQEFANDTSQLLAVSAKENRSKSDKGPSDYMPPNREFRCEYSKKWVETANKYGVSITSKDKATLTNELKKCNS